MDTIGRGCYLTWVKLFEFTIYLTFLSVSKPNGAPLLSSPYTVLNLDKAIITGL